MKWLVVIGVLVITLQGAAQDGKVVQLDYSVLIEGRYTYNIRNDSLLVRDLKQEVCAKKLDESEITRFNKYFSRYKPKSFKDEFVNNKIYDGWEIIIKIEKKDFKKNIILRNRRQDTLDKFFEIVQQTSCHEVNKIRGYSL